MYRVCIFLIALSLLLFIQCKKTDTKEPGFHIRGIVVDESGTPVNHARVSVEGRVVPAGSDGSFELTGLPGRDRYNVKVASEEYFTQYQNLENPDGSRINAKIVMIRKEDAGTIPEGGGTVSRDNVKVMAENNAFMKPDGSAYSGPVHVSARYVAVSNPVHSRSIPGGQFAARDPLGNEGQLRNAGFVATRFTDRSGNVLTPTRRAKIAIQLSTGSGIPQGARSWNFDTISLKWVPSSIPATESGSEVYLSGEQTYQTVATLVPYGTVEGKAQCTNGSAVANQEITLTGPDNTYTAITNANGLFRVRVEATSAGYTIKGTSGVSVQSGSVAANRTVTAPALLFTNCGGAPSSQNAGSFTTGGRTYTGTTYFLNLSGSGGYNNAVVIYSVSGTDTSSFTMYNVPAQGSGTFAIQRIDSVTNAAQTWGKLDLRTNTYTLYTKEGTLTKTGANSFTFTCTVFDWTSIILGTPPAPQAAVSGSARWE